MALRLKLQPSDAQFLEITLISAQDVKKPHAYAVVWVHPSVKLRTHVDHAGGENPTWNDKFVFKVSTSFLSSYSSSAVHIEIYATGYLIDSLQGSVSFLVGNQRLLMGNGPEGILGIPSFSAVGIRRPSGRLQGILNIGSMLLSLRQVSTAAQEELERSGAAVVGGENEDPKVWRRRTGSRASFSRLPSWKETWGGMKDSDDEKENFVGGSSSSSPWSKESGSGDRREMNKGWFGRKVGLSPSDPNLHAMMDQ
ncbi:Calcium-dependent lipid-binding (CaLB domain) family [Zostera marina]|uniref:Calcium-dependent lipid-binding (CaLB domain) family n=1 Tax=Zostera marina TaxID=29655 RepID=A0A0K9NM12_ZOSMR|nr:Calcium-dependent lipid-binding (CaLB domain) family [Zostera marina]